MQVLKLLQSHDCKLKHKLGAEIGNGADGQVFDLVEFKNRVIKLCVIYDAKAGDYNKVSRVLEYLYCHNPNICAHIYEYGFLCSGERDTFTGKQKYIIYYYVMEKLDKTSEDERKVFHSILSHEDRGIKKDFSDNVIRKMLRGMRCGLDFDMDKVTLFHKNIRNSPVRHLDMHVRNIMKDRDGNFKLIDFDRINIGA